MLTRYFLIYCTKTGGLKLHIYRERKHADMQWVKALNDDPIWGFMLAYSLGPVTSHSMEIITRCGEVK